MPAGRRRYEREKRRDAGATNERNRRDAGATNERNGGTPALHN